MIITKKSLPRRTFLRGAGAAIGLPLLDAMIPALTAQAKTAAAPVRRLAFVYIPNGVILNTPLPNGSVIDHWTPATEGALGPLPQILKPLEAHRDQLIVISGLGAKPADSIGEGNGDHARACSTWLNQTRIKHSESELRAGVTIDQIAADVLGKETALRSLEVGVEDFRVLGGCDNGYSCAYFNSLAWRTPTTPLVSEPSPRIVFKRLFGSGGSPAERRAELATNRSILDSVTAQLARLNARLGQRDRQKLDEYLDSLRELETRIGKLEKQSDAAFLAAPSLPMTGAPDTYEDHVTLMYDLQVAAFTADVTRVTTFLTAREVSSRGYPNIGVPESHHGLSHHGNDTDKIAKLVKINTHHAQLFASFLDKLRATREGDGSLLDHITILYGGGMSNGNTHSHSPLPALLVGAAAGQLKGGRHLKYAEGTPMANLLVRILDIVGIGDMQVGDSTGPLAGV